MKKYKFLLILFFIVLSISCVAFLISAQNQKVESPEASIINNNSNSNSNINSINNNRSSKVNTEVPRNVLIELFINAECTTCPKAAFCLEELAWNYEPGRVILKGSKTLTKFLPEVGSEAEKFLQNFDNYQRLEKIFSELSFYKDEIVLQFNGYLLRGGYPGIAKKERLKADMLLRDIKQVYIEKDIIETLRVEKHLAFSNLLELIAYQIGSLVNLEELCRNVKISFPTLKNFLNILEKTYIIELLQPYFKNQRKAVRKNKKVYFLDTGFRNACIGLTNFPSNPNEVGHLVENMAFNILQKANSYLFSESAQIFFYRTYDGAEIDFVLKRGNEILPIEVKYQNFVKEKIPLVMENFMKTKGEECQKGIVITRDFMDKKSYDFGEIYFIPLSLIALNNISAFNLSFFAIPG